MTQQRLFYACHSSFQIDVQRLRCGRVPVAAQGAISRRGPRSDAAIANYLEERRRACIDTTIHLLPATPPELASCFRRR